MTNQSEVPTCECCGQPMPKPQKPKSLLATHRVETHGYPAAFALKADHALDIAEQRWNESGVKSYVYACAPKMPWGFWRTYPD